MATDARRREVYWGRYENGLRVSGPGVAKAAELAWTGAVAGHGATLYPDDLRGGQDPQHARAGAVAACVAAGWPTFEPVPLYLRQPDATPSLPKRVLT